MRGLHPKLQTKQAVTCAVMKINEKGIANEGSKQLLSKLLPHQNEDCRNDWIKQCTSSLHDHQSGNSDALCTKYEMTRNSYEYICASNHFYNLHSASLCRKEFAVHFVDQKYNICSYQSDTPLVKNMSFLCSVQDSQEARTNIWNWWIKQSVKEHPKYDSIEHKTNTRKRRRVSNNSNHTNR